MIILIIGISILLANLFLYCFFGKMASESFDQMTECLYESNWQTFPIEFQKYVLLMIGNAQRPLFYEGFGLVALNLRTFTKVGKFVKAIK